MRRTTLKTAVVLLGKLDHFELIKNMDLGTQNDITQKGMSLIMPMILAVLAGFMFSKESFGYGAFVSSVVGLLLAVMVMIVDRSFLNKIGEVTVRSKFIRVVVSLLLALVSSSGIDLALYHNDVQEEIRNIASERTNSSLKSLEHKLMDLKQSIAEKEAEAIDMKDIYISEMATGVGERARAKKAMYDDMMGEASRLKQAKELVSNQIAQNKLEYEQEMVDELQGSLLIKMEALHRVVLSSFSTAFFWILLVLLVSLFDLLPLMVKNKALNGYDQLMLAEIQKSLMLYKPIEPEKAKKAYEAHKAKHDATRIISKNERNTFSLN